MKRTTLLFIFFTTTVTVTVGQEKPAIVTDRPDQTESPALVPQGGLHVETGFILEQDLRHGIQHTNYTYNTTLIKYGINENFEFRLISEYAEERVVLQEKPDPKIEGFSPLALGMKIKLSDEKDFWPQAALIGHVNLRTGSDDYAPEYTAGDFRFTCAHTLSDKFSLSYNAGVEWDGETPEATFIYTLSLGYAINDDFGVFVESYSFFPEESRADNRADAGITYKFTPVVQWDFSGGFGLSDNAPDYFLSTGISFRMFE
jgi:hypothetical protein